MVCARYSYSFSLSHSLLSGLISLEGLVMGVADGDTITLLDGNRQQHRIRLTGIDAREKAQPFGQRSKQHLSELAFGKDAKVVCYKIDRYDREVCTVYVNGKDVGLAQLDAGLAWWFREYAHEQVPRDRVDYETAEDRAAADREDRWSRIEPYGSSDDQSRSELDRSQDLVACNQVWLSNHLHDHNPTVILDVLPKSKATS
jgi:endonuclease YncB( thermonuclease family)